MVSGVDHSVPDWTSAGHFLRGRDCWCLHSGPWSQAEAPQIGTLTCRKRQPRPPGTSRVRAASENGAPVGMGGSQCGTSGCGPNGKGPLLKSLSILLSRGSTWGQELPALASSGAPQQVSADLIQTCGPTGFCPHSPKVTHKGHSDGLSPSDTER